MKNRIVLGELSSPIVIFEPDEIETTPGITSVDIISDTLSVDRLDPTVRYKYIAPTAYGPVGYDGIATADGFLYCAKFNGINLATELPYGTPLHFFRNRQLRGRYYTETVLRSASDKWEISAQSLVGLLDTQEHKGGVYTGESFSDVLASIWGGETGASENGLVPIIGGPEPCWINEGLAAMNVYGWLPYDTRRKNLHTLLFCYGASLTRDVDGRIIFRWLNNFEPEQIEADRIYIGGSVQYDAAATGIELAEHVWQWSYNDSPQKIFDNTDVYAEPAVHQLIKFSEPIRVDTATTNGALTVEEIGQNYAVVSGKGVLNAVPYVHLTRTVSRYKTTDRPGKIQPFTNATLCNALNSENILTRLYNFYTQAKNVSAIVNIKDEHSGGAYSFTNSFGEREDAVLSALSFEASGVMRGECTFVTDYTPGPFGNNFNNTTILTGAGTWWIPTAVRESDFPFIRLTMVGGGSGGDGGEGGKQGRGTYINEAGEYTDYGGGYGGGGGKGGKGGQPGKVLTIAKLDVSQIARIAYVCGAAGAPGNKGVGGYQGTDPIPPTPGTAGEETELIFYDDVGNELNRVSTASGYILPSGVLNLTTNTLYALAGKDGTDGANGGEGGAAAYGAVGFDGGSVEYEGLTYPGGLGSDCEYDYIPGTQLVAYCGGGGGGGAAVGAPGGNAPTPGRAMANHYVWGGDGGEGATPEIMPQDAPSTHYGQGGHGGHGGGGGGTGGAQNWRPLGSAIKDGLPGTGGDGTDGGKASNGCIFMYW